MKDARIEYEKLRYVAIREKLAAEDPDLDEQTLADTTEGLTNLHEMLAAIVRGAVADETMAEALRQRIVDMGKRLERFVTRAQRRRELVRDTMVEADIAKIVKEDFTASLRSAPPHVVVIDESLIPQTFWEARPHLRRRELLDALKDGAEVSGAVLSNPGMSLSVRTK
jgi:hypothetical protein